MWVYGRVNLSVVISTLLLENVQMNVDYNNSGPLSRFDFLIFACHPYSTREVVIVTNKNQRNSLKNCLAVI